MVTGLLSQLSLHFSEFLRDLLMQVQGGSSRADALGRQIPVQNKNFLATASCRAEKWTALDVTGQPVVGNRAEAEQPSGELQGMAGYQVSEQATTKSESDHCSVVGLGCIFLNFIEGQMIYNVALVSGLQSDLVIYVVVIIHMCVHIFLLNFFSIIDYYKEDWIFFLHCQDFFFLDDFKDLC